MKIYQFAPDYDHFKFFTLSDQDGSSKRARTFVGQALAANWTPIHALLFHGKSKAEKHRREDFVISCYDKRVFIVAQCIADWFSARFSKENVEILPIETDIGRFFFVNVTDVIAALNFDGLTDEEKMEMMRSNQFRFKREVIGNRTIFRDATIKEIFVTQDFIDQMAGVTINGAMFREIGTAS